MRIKVVSDLHLEFSDIQIPNNEDVDVLILAGDIAIAEDLYDCPKENTDPSLGGKHRRAATYRDFFTRCSQQYPHVIYIAGNHEFYRGKFYAGLDYLRQECSTYPNIYFLEDEVKIINNIVFVGATLWTDMNKGDPITLHAVRDMMNDFNSIRDDNKNYSALKPADTVLRHRRSLEYIKHVVAEQRDKTCVVVGHHSPSYQSIHPQYANDQIINGAFHSDLTDVMLDNENIKLWIHGHTHHAFDYAIGECRVVCNPRGYESFSHKEHTGWDPVKVIEL